MGKSKSAKICERIARRAIVPKGRTMSEVLLEFRRYKGKKRYSLPLLQRMKENVDDIMSGDLQLFYMNVESDSSDLIIYFHGGAYVEEMLPFHWLMLDKITAKVAATFIIPDYPLAPYNDFKECYDKLLVFYRKVLKYYPDRRIIFMGDSAGGGLAVGLCMYFAEKKLRLPEKLILLSPWVDLVMDNPEIKDYIETDPLLKYDELKVDAEYWANGTDLKDYRLSPIYGDVACLKDVTMFAGTHEFFYPDIRRFSRILDEYEVKNSLYVGEGLNHVYPAFPIPEADTAIKIIIDRINDH